MENKNVRFWLNATLFYTLELGAFSSEQARKKRLYCFDRLVLAIERLEKSNKEMKNAIEYALDNCVDLIGTEEGCRLQRAIGQEIYSPFVEYDIK